MKVLLLFFLLIYCSSFSQDFENENFKKCNVKFEIDTTNLSKTRKFELKITNFESKNIRVPKNFAEIRIQIQNLERYDSELDKFVKESSSFSDVNCNNCNHNQFTLKHNKSINYIFNIHDLYLVEKRLKQTNTIYRFNLLFDNIDFSYNKKLKCYINSFESPKILYKTPK